MDIRTYKDGLSYIIAFTGENADYSELFMLQLNYLDLGHVYVKGSYNYRVLEIPNDLDIVNLNECFGNYIKAWEATKPSWYVKAETTLRSLIKTGRNTWKIPEWVSEYPSLTRFFVNVSRGEVYADPYAVTNWEIAAASKLGRSMVVI